jgi:hypothetical protein
LALVVAAMMDKDVSELRIIAEASEELRIGALAYIFRDDLREEGYGLKPARDDDDKFPTDQCSMM